ncbi:MAG: hypothetical protein EPN69_13335 [Rhodanobacter sp.]|nr:MAG: hypothetical protein EPN69_13335 [Rhodanobacter sp.]TAM40870.1 MAG: hypothetical protein EPN58_08185 [Rhodanobacter sp.]TAN25730.1 MAG: hypothetical protein EPN32_09090 [Rhodanobacter sp.]
MEMYFWSVAIHSGPEMRPIDSATVAAGITHRIPDFDPVDGDPNHGGGTELEVAEVSVSARNCDHRELTLPLNEEIKTYSFYSLRGENIHSVS